jgi:hypothetical protein
MPALYDLTGHAQLSSDVTDLEAEVPGSLEWHTLLAEQVLGVPALFISAGPLELATMALVLQVNWQVATDVDARMVVGASRAGVTFRSEPDGSFPLADPMAARVWARALAAAIESGDVDADDTSAGSGNYNTLRSGRGGTRGVW